MFNFSKYLSFYSPLHLISTLYNFQALIMLIIMTTILFKNICFPMELSTIFYHSFIKIIY